MERYYIPSVQPGIMNMPQEEAHHAIKVMRHKIGDAIEVMNGMGSVHPATIISIGKRSCEIDIGTAVSSPKGRNYCLHIAIAPTKNAARWEWFLEKAAEIGTDEITPLICNHSERRRINMERSEKILVSAMKQSGNPWLTRLNETCNFKKLLNDKEEHDNRLIAYCGDIDKTPLSSEFRSGERHLICIGPEGDFSPAEVSEAIEEGFRVVSLGNSRLRTETAGIAACHTISLMDSLRH